jgi:dephospho-CoA kinase
MKRIGITGGIGSGKSVATRLFAMLGVPVYDADTAARRLMEGHSGLKQEIAGRFGSDVYSQDGKLDRTKLAQQVFGDESALEELNRMVHPRVMEDYERWNMSHSEADYTLREAAILYESGTWRDLDLVILVDAPEALRLKRTIQRDNRSEAEVRSIMSRQWSTEKKRALADHIIENDERHAMIPQVLRIDAAIRKYPKHIHATS